MCLSDFEVGIDRSDGGGGRGDFDLDREKGKEKECCSLADGDELYVLDGDKVLVDWR